MLIGTHMSRQVAPACAFHGRSLSTCLCEVQMCQPWNLGWAHKKEHNGYHLMGYIEALLCYHSTWYTLHKATAG